jgi:hypothetical protein
MPKTKSTSTKGISAAPYESSDRPNPSDASSNMATKPTALVAILANTNPSRYSDNRNGVAKKLRKLRAHTSSRNDIDTPCITRVRKSHNNTAPRSPATKL